MYILQSILFDRNLFDLKECIEWIEENNFKILKVDITSKYNRFRQEDPKDLIKQGYNNVITKDLHNGIKLILYYK